MNLMVERLRPTAILPQRATAGSAGYDLCACLDAPVVLQCGAIARIPTGLAVAPDTTDAALLIFARSGLAAKHGICLANGVGLIDSDYRGELLVALINLGGAAFEITHGMRIAQLVVTQVAYPQLFETDALPDTARGTGGFGSTGIHT